jgi:hypothetical protein
MKVPQEIVDRIRGLAATGDYSIAEIAQALGRTKSSVEHLCLRNDIHTFPRGCAKGHRNHFWKGGRTIDKHGYVLLKTYNHPFANSGGYVREHRLVMEEHLKRYLLPNEVVHHLDGNKENNALENLELFQSNAEHLRIELSGKCPKWTSQGLERQKEALERNREPARKRAATRRRSKNGAFL